MGLRGIKYILFSIYSKINLTDKKVIIDRLAFEFLPSMIF